MKTIFGSVILSVLLVSSPQVSFSAEIDSEADFLPQLTSADELSPIIKTNIQKLAKKQNLTPEAIANWTNHLTHYLGFLGLKAKDLKKEKDPTNDQAPVQNPAQVAQKAPAPNGDDDGGGDDASANKIGTFTRLLSSSLEFLQCKDLNDWACLEKTPELAPKVKFRVETKNDLGNPILAGDSLDTSFFYTDQWDIPENKRNLKNTVVNRLGDALSNPQITKLSMAVYGVDDLDGSMAPAYHAIQRIRARDTNAVRSVFDITAPLENAALPWTLTYTAPKPVNGAEHPLLAAGWLLENIAKPHLKFQYDDTLRLLTEINQGIENDNESRARLEWPIGPIMHNKFIVMENAQGPESVWTGTANISAHCMGIERNANVSVHIKNPTIASAYQTEFEEMFQFDPSVDGTTKITGENGSAPNLGRFHHNKRPNTPRYFTFNDGTEVRLYFSPTDDGEHRALIPMLLSARAGDLIRISMFGGAGYEYIRAMQYAAAMGATIELVFDRMLAAGQYSWMNAPSASLKEKNPFVKRVVRRPGQKPGNIIVKLSSWEGKNHHKSATLTRFDQKTGTYRPELLVLGSQNWSAGGNDENDENMLMIRNTKKTLPFIVEYNQYFDRRLWKKAVPARN